MRFGAQVLIVGVVYALLGWIGLHHAYLPTSVSLLWLPTGWAIGMVWWWGRSALLGAGLAVLALSLAVEGWGWYGLVRALISWLAYGSIVGLLRRNGFDPSFGRLREVFFYSFLSAGVLLLTAGLQNGVTWLSGRLPSEQFAISWLHWWGSNFLGGLLMGTPILAISHFRSLRWLQWGEIASIMGLVAGLTYGVRSLDPSEYAPLLLVLSLPLMVWAVLRQEIAGMSLPLLTLAVSLGPPFGIVGELDRANMTSSAFSTYWLFLVVSYHTMMILAVYVRQKREFAEKLEDAYLQLEAILENAPTVAIQGYDAEGRVVFWNRASEQMYGYTREQAVGKTLGQLLFSPEQEQEYHAMIRTILQSQKPAPLKEWTIATATGETRYILSSLFPIHLRERTVVICADIDITERKRLEQQLLQTQKMESIGRLAGGIAHDFNNLLAAIMGFAELASSRLPPDHPVQQDLSHILAGAEKAAGLVRQLLGFARKQFAQPRATDVNQVVQEMRPLLERSLGERIQLDLQLSAQPAIILIDPAQLEQILLNLVLNARDAMPQGGSITLRTEHLHSTHSLPALPTDAPPGKYVCLIVQDEGTGIASTDLPHIFEPFYTTKGVHGHGLGLATVYGIVVQNRGFIQVHSQPDVGTAFRIYFPLLEASVAVSPPSSEPETRATTARILLVEDDEAVRESLSLMLQAIGYTVHACALPEEALRLAQEMPVDILITDISLPHIDGYQLAEQIAHHHPRCGCLFISGYQQVHPPRKLLIRHTFLAKPFTLRQLQEALNELLS